MRKACFVRVEMKEFSVLTGSAKIILAKFTFLTSNNKTFTMTFTGAHLTGSLCFWGLIQRVKELIKWFMWQTFKCTLQMSFFNFCWPSSSDFIIWKNTGLFAKCLETRRQFQRRRLEAVVFYYSISPMSLKQDL